MSSSDLAAAVEAFVGVRPDLQQRARPAPQAGQTKPSGQRRSNRNVAQLVSSGKVGLELS